MGALGLTHEAWYNLPRWQREEWIAREIEREEGVRRLIDALKDKQKGAINPYGLNAVVLLQASLL
jgi:hypothetical protein